MINIPCAVIAIWLAIIFVNVLRALIDGNVLAIIPMAALVFGYLMFEIAGMGAPDDV